MGHEIESVALRRGHVIGMTVDIGNSGDLTRENLAGMDVAIEFSSPDSAFSNVMQCLESGIPVVSGTTGWSDRIGKAVAACRENDTAFIHSTNFSIGVNLLFRLNEELAKLISGYAEYSVTIEEIHHVKKLDAPSGTALSLVNGIAGNHPAYSGWSFAENHERGSVPVKSVREGEVPGTHIVTWDSGIDTLALRHEAKNRHGFAIGAVVAAEYIHNKKGIFSMRDVMGF